MSRVMNAAAGIAEHHHPDWFVSKCAEATQYAPVERVLELPELGAGALLAIDTALGSSVALGHAGLGYECSHDGAREHVEVIAELIERACTHARVRTDEITAVVVGVGPGPFTGLRVGIAAATAFAAARGVPLWPVLGHDAVALAVRAADYRGSLRVVQDAKRSELFVTGYDGVEPETADAADLPTTARRRYAASVPVRSSEPSINTRTEFIAQPGDVWPTRIPAARLVQLAARMRNADIAFEPQQALYLRAPDVTLASSVKRVSG